MPKYLTRLGCSSVEDMHCPNRSLRCPLPGKLLGSSSSTLRRGVAPGKQVGAAKHRCSTAPNEEKDVLKSIRAPWHPFSRRLWVKNRYPNWNPSKWKHGPKPVVPWWFNFDPNPNSVQGVSPPAFGALNQRPLQCLASADERPKCAKERLTLSSPQSHSRRRVWGLSETAAKHSVLFFWASHPGPAGGALPKESLGRPGR